MTYLDSTQLSQPDTSGMPVLRIQPNAPVQVTMPQRAAAQQGGAGGGGLNSAALGKKIAALLQAKYGAGGAGAVTDATGDPDPDWLYTS